MKKLLIISTLLLSFGVCYGQDTIVATYKYSEFGDLPHIVFEMDNGQEIDFGQGDNDFCGLNIIADFTNQELKDKRFLVVYTQKKVKTYNEYHNVVEVLAPSITFIELRTRGPTNP